MGDTLAVVIWPRISLPSTRKSQAQAFQAITAHCTKVVQVRVFHAVVFLKSGRELQGYLRAEGQVHQACSFVSSSKCARQWNNALSSTQGFSVRNTSSSLLRLEKLESSSKRCVALLRIGSFIFATCMKDCKLLKRGICFQKSQLFACTCRCSCR